MTTKNQATKTAPASDPKVDDELAKLTTVSAKIRYLTSIGWKRSAIATKLGKLYQHVRNVQLQPLKKAS